MHWLLASLLVLPPRTGPLPLVGLKRDARRTELVFQHSSTQRGVWPEMGCTSTSFLARTDTAIQFLTGTLLTRQYKNGAGN